MVYHTSKIYRTNFRNQPYNSVFWPVAANPPKLKYLRKAYEAGWTLSTGAPLSATVPDITSVDFLVPHQFLHGLH